MLPTTLAFGFDPTSNRPACEGRIVDVSDAGQTRIECTGSQFYSLVSKAEISKRISHPKGLYPYFESNRDHSPIFNFTRELRQDGKLIGYHSMQAYETESSEDPMRVTTRYNLKFQPVSIRVE